MSDNGWFNGEHRWFSEKLDMFEPAIQRPAARPRPRLPRPAHADAGDLERRLAPTIVELADATPGRLMDGESLLPYAAKRKHRNDRAVSIESAWPGTSGLTAVFRARYNGVQIMYEGVRTRRYKYVEYYKDVNGMPAREEQLYDLRTDPHELQSLHKDPAYAGSRSACARRSSACASARATRATRASRPTVAKTEGQGEGQAPHGTKRRGRR